MTVFFDDFNRAGPGGGDNWTLDQYCQLAGQLITVTQAAYHFAACMALSSAGAMKAECDCYYVDANSLTAGPVVKMNTTQVTTGYHAYLTTSGGLYYLNIRQGSAGTLIAGPTEVASQAPFAWHLSIEYDQGVVTATYNNTVTITGNDMSQSALARAGLMGYGTGVRMDNFRMVVGGEATLTVSPDPIGNFGSAVPVTFTGVGTAWTPGTPGTPTFTVNHGTLSNQVIASATSATADYSPGNFLGTATFTDPSTGATDSVLVTSDTAIITPSGPDPWLHDDGQLVIDTIHGTAPTLLRTDNIVLLGQWGAANLNFIQAIAEIWAATHYDYANPAGADSIVAQLQKVWQSVNGKLDVADPEVGTQTAQTLNQMLTYLTSLFYDPNIQQDWKLYEVVAAVKGLDNRSITQVYDLVSGLSAGSNQDVLDALAAYFGLNPPTIEQLGTMVSDLATVAGYSLGDVLDAIADIPTADLSPVMTKLNTIQPAEAITLSTVGTSAASASTAAIAAEALLGTISGGGTITLGAILEAIAALSDLVNALDTSAGAPVWPGIAGVDLLDPIAVTNAWTYTGVCDGILLSIQQELVKQPTMKIGTISTYRTMGRVAFVSDSGEIEPWQPIPGSACVMMPKQMLHAGGFIIGFYHTVDATVVPWTIKTDA